MGNIGSVDKEFQEEMLKKLNELEQKIKEDIEQKFEFYNTSNKTEVIEINKKIDSNKEKLQKLTQLFKDM